MAEVLIELVYRIAGDVDELSHPDQTLAVGLADVAHNQRKDAVFGGAVVVGLGRGLHRAASLDKSGAERHHVLFLGVHGLFGHGVWLSLPDATRTIDRKQPRGTGTKEDAALLHVIAPLLIESSQPRLRLTHQVGRLFVVRAVSVMADVDFGHVVQR